MHLDDPSILASTNFKDIISGCDLRKLVNGPTDVAGHSRRRRRHEQFFRR